jgi:hypothetical protein
LNLSSLICKSKQKVGITLVNPTKSLSWFDSPGVSRDGADEEHRADAAGPHGFGGEWSRDEDTSGQILKRLEDDIVLGNKRHEEESALNMHVS